MRCLCVLLLFNVLCVWGQTSSGGVMFQPLTLEQGLPHNYVHSVTQDRKGFIWIGTNYGLARYDGYSYRVFQPDLQKKNSITHKPVSRLFADSKERLWFAINTGGINKMDIQTERFTGYFFDSTGKKHLGFMVHGFLEDGDSTIWLASDRGLFRYDERKDAFDDALIYKDSTLLDLTINSTADDNCGHLWLVFRDRLYLLDKKTLALQSYNQYIGLGNGKPVVVRGVFSNQKGKVWVSTERDGLFCHDAVTHRADGYLKGVQSLCNVFVDRLGNVFATTNNPAYKLYACPVEGLSAGEFKEYALFDSPFLFRYMRFADDQQGNLWIASPLGLGSFNFKTGFSNYLNFNKNYGLPGRDIEDIFIDNTDNLWISPYRLGLYKADLRQKPFNVYDFTGKGVFAKEVERSVSSIFVDGQNHIWMGESANGVSCYDRKTDRYFRFYLNTTDLAASLFEDSEGYIWAGGHWDNLFRFKKPDLDKTPSGQLIKPADVARFEVNGVRKIAEDRDRNLWLASGNGLVEWQRSSGEFKNHSLLYDSLNTNSGFYRTVLIDGNNVVWGGSNNGGLCRYDKADHLFKHYMHIDSDPNSISNNSVYAIYQLPDGRLLLGTGQGLVRMDVETEVFANVFDDAYLAQRSIFSIFPDAMGNIWMSCDAGIIQYNLTTKSSFIYGGLDGLKDNEFRTTASFMAASGEIFYGGSTGLVSFVPSEIKANPLPAKPVVTNFMLSGKIVTPGDSINGRVMLRRQIWDTKRVELFYYENDFWLEFSALHYSAPGKIIYQYRLLGFNDQWVTLTANRRWSNFTGLPPGKYVLEMRATNNDGVMCDPSDVVKLDIVIRPPYWQTLLFKALLIVLLILLVVLFLNLRLRRLYRQKRQLETMVDRRTAELAESNILLEERQEEITTQNDILGRTNKLLEERQEEIQAQNDELQHHRQNLEKLVADKTSDLEMALRKSEESDRLKTAFLANLSHEIRTPMNAIIGFSNLLPTASDDEERDSFVQIINNNCESLLVLISDIVDISMIEANQVSIYRTSVDMVALMQEVEANFKVNNRKNIDIVFDAPHGHLVLFTDGFRVRQILNNLIGNSIKFTDEGSVRFGYSVDHETVRFYVRDTGIGISPDDFDKIFDHFHKKEMIQGRVFRGTGIGLSICKSLVELLGGSISVDSEVGRGSLFEFTLPLS